jgi:hypothetical protein
MSEKYIIKKIRTAVPAGTETAIEAVAISQ